MSFSKYAEWAFLEKAFLKLANVNFPNASYFSFSIRVSTAQTMEPL